jgi:hypothetical protein
VVIREDEQPERLLVTATALAPAPRRSRPWRRNAESVMPTRPKPVNCRRNSDTSSARSFRTNVFVITPTIVLREFVALNARAAAA